jgi:hypothetical protein
MKKVNIYKPTNADKDMMHRFPEFKQWLEAKIDEQYRDEINKLKKLSKQRKN